MIEVSYRQKRLLTISTSLISSCVQVYLHIRKVIHLLRLSLRVGRDNIIRQCCTDFGSNWAYSCQITVIEVSYGQKRLLPISTSLISSCVQVYLHIRKVIHLLSNFLSVIKIIYNKSGGYSSRYTCSVAKLWKCDWPPNESNEFFNQ